MVTYRRFVALVLMCALGWLASAGVSTPGYADEVAPSGEWTWPLQPEPTPTRYFDPPDKPWGSGHRGVDLAAAPGQAVLAAGAGTVAFVGMVAGRPVISIQHPSGLRTTYEPVQSNLTAGEPVAQGQQIGTVLAGHRGCTASACLHWGLRRGAQYLDPLMLVGPGEVRLLPIDIRD